MTQESKSWKKPVLDRSLFSIHLSPGLLLIIMVWLCGLPAAQASEQQVVLAGMDVTVWSEGTAGSTPRPVIIFSHGFHGCATQSRFLMKALASAGYLVFAPNHSDAACNGGKSNWTDRPDLPFQRPGTWNENTYRSRGEDIRRLIEGIRKDDRFSALADLSRLGLAGHSLGGYTVLGLGGAWPGWKLDGVKAVLALSAYTQPFLNHGTLSDLSAPVMYQGGTWDFGITPALRKPMGTYDSSPQPKYYVEFKRTGHLAWSDIGIMAHDAIIAYSLAFLDHYVKGEPADPLLSQARSLPGVAAFKYSSEIGRSDLTSPE